MLILFHFKANAQNLNSLSNDEFARLDSLIQAKTNYLIDSTEQMLTYYLDLKKICDQKDYELGRALCDLYISSCYYHLNDGEKVLEYANNAIQKAEKLKNDTLLLSAKISVARQLGHSWMNKEALEALDECENLAKRIKDPKTRNKVLGNIYSSRAMYMGGLNPPPSTRELLTSSLQALKYYELSEINTSVILASQTVAYFYLHLEKYDSSAYYLQKSLEICRTDNRLNSRLITYISLGSTKCLQRDFPLAIAYLDSARYISEGAADYYLYTLYDSYKAVYDSLNITDSLQKYTVLSEQYKNLMNESDRDNILSTSSYMINSKLMQYLSEKKKRIIILLSALLIIAVATVFIVTFYRKKEKFRKEKFHKDRELLQKANEIIDLKHKVTHTYDELLELARKNDPLFIPVFKELYPGFYTNLMKVQPDMTATELKICFCLKLNFTTKEIAQSTFVTIKAIQNRKNRLRKRLHLQEGEDLYKFINELAE